MAELLRRTIYFLGFCETKFGKLVNFFALATLGVKGLSRKKCPRLPRYTLLNFQLVQLLTISRPTLGPKVAQSRLKSPKVA